MFCAIRRLRVAGLTLSFQSDDRVNRIRQHAAALFNNASLQPTDRSASTGDRRVDRPESLPMTGPTCTATPGRNARTARMTRHALRPAKPGGNKGFPRYPSYEGYQGNQQAAMMERNMNKEEIYDNHISPLMKQIVSICRAQGISMIASFDIAHDGVGPNGEDCSNLVCNTLLSDGQGRMNRSFVRAYNCTKRGRYPTPTMGKTGYDRSLKILMMVI